MDNKNVSSALEEVQKAYKVVFDFNKVLQDMLHGFFKEFEGFSYYYRSVTSQPRDNPLNFSGECAIPANQFSVLYTRSKKNVHHLCLEKGDALVSCQVVVNESLFSPQTKTADGKPFLYTAVFAATEDVPPESFGNEDNHNWYYKIWNMNEYSEHKTSRKISEKPWISIYTEIIPLESMYDAASIKTVAADFKERAAKELRVNL